MSKLLDKLEWRHAIKRMNPAKAVLQDMLDRVVEAARLAHTSSGLHRLKVVMGINQVLREQIKLITPNQGQITRLMMPIDGAD